MSAQAFPVLTLTRTLSGTVVANRFIGVAGAYPSADANVLGVVRTAGDSGAKVPVDVLGTTVVTAGAAVSAGDTLKTTNVGKAITWATSGAKVAIALQAAAADGDLIEVLLIPNVA